MEINAKLVQNCSYFHFWTSPMACLVQETCRFSVSNQHLKCGVWVQIISTRLPQHQPLVTGQQTAQFTRKQEGCQGNVRENKALRICVTGNMEGNQASGRQRTKHSDVVCNHIHVHADVSFRFTEVHKLEQFVTSRSLMSLVIWWQWWWNDEQILINMMMLSSNCRLSAVRVSSVFMWLQQMMSCSNSRLMWCGRWSAEKHSQWHRYTLRHTDTGIHWDTQTHVLSDTHTDTEKQPVTQVHTETHRHTYTLRHTDTCTVRHIYTLTLRNSLWHRYTLRHTDTGTDRHTYTDTEKQPVTQVYTEIHRHMYYQTHIHWHWETACDTGTHWDTQTQVYTETHRHMYCQTHIYTDTEKQPVTQVHTETHRHRYWQTHIYTDTDR